MMKRSLKKFVTVLMIAAMIVSCVPSMGVFAASGEKAVITLVDFAGGNFKRVDRNPNEWLKLTDEVSYSDGEKSLEWTMNNNNFNIYSGGFGLDTISANKTVNIRFKADEGTRFNLVYQRERNASGANTVKHLVTADGTWQTYSVDFEKIKSVYADDTFSIKFDCSGWGFANNETENYYVPGTKLYIDSIWAETAYDKKNEKVLLDFDFEKAPSVISAAGSGFYEMSEDADEGKSNSLRYVLSGDRNDLKIACPQNVNWNLYDTVIFRMKADKLENSERTYQKLNFIFSGPAVLGDSSTYKMLSANISVDTWQDVEFKISDLSGALAAGENTNNIGLVRFNVGGWSNTDYETGAAVYLDSIILSRNEDFPGKLVAVDFDASTGYSEVYSNSKSHTLKSTENPYGAKSQNLKWNITKDQIKLRIKLKSALNLTDYDTVAFRVYSTAEQVVHFMVSNGTGVSSNDKSYRKAQTVPAAVWTTIKLSKADIQASKLGTEDANYVHIQVGGWSTNAVIDSNIYVDSVWVEKADCDVMLDAPVCAFDGLNDVKPYLDGYNKLTFEFSEELYPNGYYDCVTVKENGVSSDIGYHVSQSGNKLNVVFEKALKNNTDYTVTLSGDYIYGMTGKYLPQTDVSFKTCAPSVTWKNAEFNVDTLPQSGEIKAVSGSVNTSGDTKNAVLIIVVYSEDNVLEAVLVSEAVSTAYGEYEYSVSVKDVSVYPGCTYKAFLWDSLCNPVPRCEADILN